MYYFGATSIVYQQPGDKCYCNIGDNLCSNCGKIKMLFTICDKEKENCTTIDTNTINNNQKYDLFEIKDKEIYLDNSEITLEFNNIWGLLDYKIHISGANKIHYLGSFNLRKYENPRLVQEYPNLYSKDYIPFTVVGDGTLDITVVNQIKKNAQGETYYKFWNIHSTDGCPSETGSTDSFPLILGQITEIEINSSDNTVTFTIPKDGYTLSDIKNKFGENEDAFYIAGDGSTMTMEEFNADPPILLKSYIRGLPTNATADKRRQFIDTLINNKALYDEGQLDCGQQYFNFSEPTFEGAQITSAWGLENIITDLRRSFSSDGHYLINFPEEKTMITTTRKDNIVFESTEEFDPNYHLVVDDITEKITDVQSLNVQAKTDKTLVELYDIYMADENDNIVKMENGTYKIKIELNDLLKKYEGYEIIYISEDNKVELIDAKVEDNYIVFNTTHLSKYGVVGKEIKKTGNIITNPQTADSVVTYGLIFASLAVAVALVVLRIKKLKNN